MKKLGTLFGQDLLLDTDDPKIFAAAERYFKQQRDDLNELRRLRTEKVMGEFSPPPSFWERLST